MNSNSFRWIVSALCLCALPGFAQNQMLNGQKHGPWEVRFEKSTVLRYKGNFDQGIPVGTFTHYHANGAKRAEMYFRGMTQVCYVLEYAENSVLLAEGKYAAPGVKDSTWRVYDLNAKLLSTETYAGGALNGPYQTYYPNGQLVETGVMSVDMKSGTWTRFDESAQKIRSVEYFEDQPHGIWTEYDENERIALRGSYVHGLKEGKWIEFSEGKPLKGTWFHQGRSTKEVNY
ncbi:MAG: toxin-antitoxin system YwqK family antitoxin [Schleiferiaceae bacterium]|nr:toxin-antitoxin system YwqK family antitoxin [Schleiferiaceae bacterium]